MNKRIRELLLQATTLRGPPFIRFKVDQEKFAELIVRECMDVAYDHTPNSEECEYQRLIHNKIRQHFGVEE